MKKSLIRYIIIITCIFNIHVFTQTPKLIGSPGGFVEQIAIHPQFPNIVFSSTVYAGAIFRSVDGGNTVEHLDAGFKDYLVTQIALPYNEKDYLYVDLFGISIMSRNAGKDWELILNSNYKPHFTFNPLNSDIMYMTRDNESLWRSNDKGSTWFEVNSFPQILDFVAVAPTDTAIIYVVANNSLYKSTNSGNDWIKTFDGGDSVYFSTRKMVVNPQNKNSVFVGSGGCLLKTTDGGKTFNTFVCGNNFTSFALNPIDTTIIYAIFGDRDFAPDGGILKSVDNGEAWYSIKNGIPVGIVTASSIEINPKNPEELYIGIGGFGVFKTNNGGEYWRLTNLSYSSSVYNISISNLNEGELLIKQYGWNIFKTDNNGENWFNPNYEPEPEILNYILDFDMNPDDNNIGLLGGGTSLYKTMDGGSNWSTINQLEGAVSVKYHKYNPDIIFAQTKDTINNFENYLSTDGGNNWDTTTTIMPSVLNNKVFSNKNDSLLFRFGNEIYKEGLYNNYVYKSLDLGTSWSKCSNGLLRFTEVYWQIKPIWCLALQENTTNILYCGQGGGLSKSIDGGEHWFQIDSILKKQEPWVSVSDILLDSYNMDRYYIGLHSGGQPSTQNFSNGGLYLTEDDAKSWRKLYDGEVKLIRADERTPRNIYFVTKFGIMHIVDTFTVTTVNNIHQSILSDYKLFNNYPNPFNPATTISYQIPTDGFVTLKVYDVLGKEVASLVNEQKTSGRYNVQFDGSNLSSGIYLYKIIAGEYVDTKKLMLMK